MVAYSFKSYFAPQIEAGTKLQTVRADRVRHARPGELIQLFVGMRTRHCRKIRPDVICADVEAISINIFDGVIACITRGSYMLDCVEMEQFAREDGFAPEFFNEASGYRACTALENMETFWLDNHGEGLFEGVLIRWKVADHA